MPKKLLIIGFVWPEPKSSAAGSRIIQLIEAFHSADYHITFASACAKNHNAYNLKQIGVEQVSIELNSSSFDDFVKQLNPDIVLFDRFMIEEQFGWRVSENCTKAIKILDTEDLHCLRKGREQAIKDKKDFNIDYLFNDTAKREIASMYRCDLSLIISEAEMNILIDQFQMDEDLLCYLPFMLNKIENEMIKSLPQFSERQHFVTIGNFLHLPNYDAVLYLKQTIWPLIKKQLPKAQLHVYGAYVSQKAKQLHNEKDGFLIKGFAEDINAIMQESLVCLAPLRFGAGLKGKLIDAMQNGTPCVMSTIAAEGMFGELPANGFIADNPIMFGQKAVETYQNENKWVEFQKNGFNIINQRFNKSNSYRVFFDRVKEIGKNLENKRSKNFIGIMLQYHALRSTKYMGKWIEEKNKTKEIPASNGS